jgi:hypothetical protein
MRHSVNLHSAHYGGDGHIRQPAPPWGGKDKLSATHARQPLENRYCARAERGAMFFASFHALRWNGPHSGI